MVFVFSLVHHYCKKVSVESGFSIREKKRIEWLKKFNVLQVLEWLHWKIWPWYWKGVSSKNQWSCVMLIQFNKPGLKEHLMVKIYLIACRWSECAIVKAPLDRDTPHIQQYKELKVPPIKKIFLISSYNHTEISR